MAAHVETGTVAAVEPVSATLSLVHLDLPAIAPLIHPGQLVLVRCADPDYPAFDPFLPRAYFVFGLDRAAGRLSLLVRRCGRGSAWLCSRGTGDRVLVHGPIGRAVAPDRLTRHLLLLGDGSIGVAAIGLIGAVAAQRGLSVTLLLNDASDDSAGLGSFPPHLLQPAVEFRVTTPSAGGLLGALPNLLAWSDELVVAASPSLLDTLQTLRRLRAAPFTLYGAKPVQAMPLFEPAPGMGGGDLLPCGTGACGACSVSLRGATRLFCLAGPAFPLETLRFQEEDEPVLHDDADTGA